MSGTSAGKMPKTVYVHTAPRLGGWWLPSPHPISCFGPKSMQMGQWGHLGHHLRFKCQSLVNSNLALATAGGGGKSYIRKFWGPKKLPAGQRKFGKTTPPPWGKSLKIQMWQQPVDGLCIGQFYVQLGSWHFLLCCCCCCWLAS